MSDDWKVLGVGVGEGTLGDPVSVSAAGGGFGVGGVMGSLGVSYFGGVEWHSVVSDDGDVLWVGGGVGNWGGVRSDGYWVRSGNHGVGVVDGSLGQVGSGDAESVDGISDVAGRLHKSMSVDVGVSSAGDAVSGTGFLFGRWTTGVSVRVLS